MNEQPPSPDPSSNPGLPAGTPPPLDPLAVTLTDITRRLDRIEQTLGLRPLLPPASPPPEAPPPSQRPEPALSPDRIGRVIRQVWGELADPAAPHPAPRSTPAPAAPPAQLGTAPANPARPITSSSFLEEQEEAEARSHARADAPAAAGSEFNPTTASIKPSRSSLDLEKLIGGKFFAALGAVALCIGAILFLKIAIERGWFSFVTPAIRCSITGAFGLALLGVGEVIRRRFGAAVAAGVSTAGIGIAYSSVLAAWGWYELLSDGTAFTLLAAVGGLGIAVATLSRQPLVAIVGLIGAYLAPVFLYKSQGPVLVLPTYLTVLLIAGQVLALRLRGWFAAAGSVAWWGTILLGAGWSAAKMATESEVVLGFITVTWLVMQAFAILRSQANAAELAAAPPSKLESNLESELFTPDEPDLVRLRKFLQRGLAPIASFSVTAGVAAIGVATLHAMPAPAPSLDWLVPAILTAACLATAIITILRRGGEPSIADGLLGLLRTAPPDVTPTAAVGLSLLAQSAAMLIVAVALGVSTDAMVIVYLTLAIAAVATGRKLRSPLLDGYGVVLLAVGAARLLHELIPAFGRLEPDPIRGWSGAMFETDVVRVLGLHLGPWNLKALLTALGAVIIGRLLLIGSVHLTRHRAARIIAALGLLPLLGSAMHSETRGESLMAAWAVLLLLAVQLDRVDQRLRLPRAVGVLAIPAAAAALLTFIVQHPTWVSIKGPPIFHLAMLVTLGMLTVLVQCRWLSLRAPWSQPKPDTKTTIAVAAMAVTAAAVFFISTTLEASRITRMLTDERHASGTGISIYWGLLAVVLIAGGMSLGFGLRGTFLRDLITRLLHAARRGPADTQTELRMTTLATRWRQIGLGLLMLTLTKVVLVNLAAVPGLWRVASFLATGALMLGVAMAYARLEKAMR